MTVAKPPPSNIMSARSFQKKKVFSFSFPESNVTNVSPDTARYKQTDGFLTKRTLSSFRYLLCLDSVAVHIPYSIDVIVI